MTDKENSEEPEERKDEFRETDDNGWKSKMPLILVVIILLLMSSIPLVIDILVQEDDSWYYDYGKYEIDFSRTYESDKEERAIEIVEHLNYSYYLGIDRFSGKPWSNYIDSVSILHYVEWFHRAQKNEEEADIDFVYDATAVRYSNLGFSVNRDGGHFILQESGVNLPIQHHSSSYTSIVEIENGVVDTRYGKGKGTGDNYHYSISLDEGYIVQMELTYDNRFGPLGATFSTDYQTVVLDEEYVPVFIISEYWHSIS